MSDGICAKHLLEHQLICTSIDGDHQPGYDKAAAALQKLLCFFQRVMKPCTAIFEISNQQKHRKYDVIQCACNGEPFHAFPKRKQNNFVHRHCRIRDEFGNGGILGLEPGLKPVVESIKHLKNEANAVQRYNHNGETFPSVHNTDNTDDCQRRQQT